MDRRVRNLTPSGGTFKMQGMVPPNLQRILEAVFTGGFGQDLVYAYYAETFPDDEALPTWEAESSTPNGRAMREFLRTVPKTIAWETLADLALPPQKYLNVRDRLVIAWIGNRVPLELLVGYPLFAAAASHGLIKTDPASPASSG